MQIKYPNGQKAKDVTKSPFGKKPKNLKKSRLGTTFEDAINESNKYYFETNRAVIYKKPTPIQIVKVEYPSRNKAKITEAYYKIPSTTDYNGIYRGQYIDFEAKSCHEKRFAFKNIYPHQINHLLKVKEHGGIAFLLIEFSLYNRVFIFPIESLVKYYQLSLTGGEKSIPFEIFEHEGYEVNIGYNPRLYYLDQIDVIFNNYFSNEKIIK